LVEKNERIGSDVKKGNYSPLKKIQFPRHQSLETEYMRVGPPYLFYTSSLFNWVPLPFHPLPHLKNSHLQNK